MKKSVFVCDSCKKPIERGFLISGPFMLIKDYEQSDEIFNHSPEENLSMCLECYGKILSRYTTATRLNEDLFKKLSGYSR